MLLEFLLQRFHFRLPRMHLFRDVRDARFEARAADALVWAVLPGLGRFFLDAAWDVGVIECQGICRLRGCGLHLVNREKSLYERQKFLKKSHVFFLRICSVCGRASTERQG